MILVTSFPGGDRYIDLGDEFHFVNKHNHPEEFEKIARHQFRDEYSRLITDCTDFIVWRPKIDEPTVSESVFKDFKGEIRNKDGSLFYRIKR